MKSIIWKSLDNNACRFILSERERAKFLNYPAGGGLGDLEARRELDPQTIGDTDRSWPSNSSDK